MSDSPRHSHSIVSSTHNRLKTLGLSQHHFNFTVRLTVKIFCLVPIEPDRCRMLLRACDGRECPVSGGLLGATAAHFRGSRKVRAPRQVR